MVTRSRNLAFTLIELLIVVAIIAILAAIAVPNFLEAQVRAKVSRSRNDLRVIATAIEAYAVDNRHYPPYGTFQNGIDVTNWGVEEQILEPSWITTPIAYISGDASMLDPFRTQPPPTTWLVLPYYFKMYNYVNLDDNRLRSLGDWGTREVVGRYGLWRLAGSGPDKLHYNANLDGTAFGVVPYDATNGTISIGDIFRWQKISEPTQTYL